MPKQPFNIIYTKKVLKDFKAITDRKSQEIIQKSLEKLMVAPHQYGEAYRSDLADFYKMRTARNFRIVYSINEEAQQVIIHVVASRDKVYEVAYDRLVKRSK